MQTTIAAVATARGEGGIGIVRISGEDAYEVAAKIFAPHSGENITKLSGYTMKYGIAHNIDGSEIDECIALFYRAPHSYTGEDVVELQAHGGSAVVELILRACFDAGARMARAGEFTRRAFENGRMNLTQAEAVMQIIGASSQREVRTARAALGGKLGSAMSEICRKLTELTASLAAWADFPEDEIPAVDEVELRGEIEKLSTQLTQIINDSRINMKLSEGIRTVICGRPNVGKSSLMNLLAGYERCIVTDIPGTTRDVIEEKISLGSVTLNVADTAGIRTTGDPIEEIGVNKAREYIENGDLVLAVFDGSEKLSEQDRELADLLRNRTAVAIINKSDKEQNIDIEYIHERIQHIVYISAREKRGIKQLISLIKEISSVGELSDAGLALCNERQLACAISAQHELVCAVTALDLGMTLDAVTVNLESAVECLLELTGERASEQIVSEIFSQFCLGK